MVDGWGVIQTRTYCILVQIQTVESCWLLEISWFLFSQHFENQLWRFVTVSGLPFSPLGCAKTGGVRFSEEPAAAAAPSHVHFDEKLHDSVVMVTPQDDGNFMVKVCLVLPDFW